MPIAPQVPVGLTHCPFTTAEARAAGLSNAALKGTEWRHVFRDVWIHASVEDTLSTRIDAAKLVLGQDGFLCGLTAAWIYGVDVQDRRGLQVWMGRRTGDWRRVRQGCLVREITVETADLKTVQEALITTPVRTAFDCARWLSLTEAVVVVDALAHAGLMLPQELASYVRSHRKLRGVRQADWVVQLLEPLTESPMESRLRVLLINAGFEKPIAQHVVTDRAGRFVARADLAYPDQRLIVEYDGAQHWEQRRADDRRRDQMRALGWTVLVASREDYYERPQEFLGQVRRAFSAASAA
jgi:very-short-patch-repair endonuclease